MKVNFYNSKAEKTTKDVEVPKDYRFSQDTFLHYLRVLLTNKRKGNSKVKTRSEVRGGGRKPWRQKGTGRARAGSIRSPLWVGGGVSHGPKRESSWYLFFNKNTKKSIFKGFLYHHVQEGSLTIVDVDLKKPSIKEFKSLLTRIYGKEIGKFLLIHDNEKFLKMSTRNLLEACVIGVSNVNAWDLVKAKKTLITKNAFYKLKDRL